MASEGLLVTVWIWLKSKYWVIKDKTVKDNKGQRGLLKMTWIQKIKQTYDDVLSLINAYLRWVNIDRLKAPPHRLKTWWLNQALCTLPPLTQILTPNLLRTPITIPSSIRIIWSANYALTMPEKLVRSTFIGALWRWPSLKDRLNWSILRWDMLPQRKNTWHWSRVFWSQDYGVAYSSLGV